MLLKIFSDIAYLRKACYCSLLSITYLVNKVSHSYMQCGSIQVPLRASDTCEPGWAWCCFNKQLQWQISPCLRRQGLPKAGRGKWFQSNILSAKEVIKDIRTVMDAQVHHSFSLSPLFILLENLYNSGTVCETQHNPLRQFRQRCTSICTEANNLDVPKR